MKNPYLVGLIHETDHDGSVLHAFSHTIVYVSFHATAHIHPTINATLNQSFPHSDHMRLNLLVLSPRVTKHSMSFVEDF